MRIWSVRILAVLAAAAILLLGGCTGYITGYAGREAEVGMVHYQINEQGKRAFAEQCVWDLDPTHRSFDIADTVEGAEVQRLGGYTGVGVPHPFRIEPERGADYISSSDPSQESFDVPVTWQDLEFTIYLGRELKEIAGVTEVPYYGVKNPSGGIDFYRPVCRFVCDEGNETFYSRDGVLYKRSDDTPAEYLGKLQVARPSGAAVPGTE